MPTIDIPDKICPHCGGTKWFIVYQTYKDKVYTVKTCSVRKKETDKKWISDNRERCCLIHKRSKDKVRYSKDYISKNRKRANVWFIKNKEKLMTSDRYAKENLSENSTPLQRGRYILYLKALRQLKKLENEKTENISKKVRKH